MIWLRSAWLVVDVLANATGFAKLPKVSAQYCQPARPTSYIVCTGNHRRWELMLLPGEDLAVWKIPSEVWRLLHRWIDPADAELWRSASYRFHALVPRSGGAAAYSSPAMPLISSRHPRGRNVPRHSRCCEPELKLEASCEARAARDYWTVTA